MDLNYELRLQSWQIIGIFVSVLFLSVVAFGIFLLVKYFIRGIKNGDLIAKIWHTLTLVSVIIMFASWVLNFGWYRVILTWFPLPLAHIIAFIGINFQSASKASLQKPLNVLIGISCFSFLLTYLAFPDGGDIGGMYVLFGLIKDKLIIDIATYVSFVALGANIVILVLEIIELNKHKKLTTNRNDSPL